MATTGSAYLVVNLGNYRRTLVATRYGTISKRSASVEVIYSKGAH